MERAIERVKNFRMLQTVVPINMIQLLDSIFTVCSFLCNFHQPLVPPVVTNLDSASSHNVVTGATHSGDSVHPHCDKDELAQTASQLNISTAQLADIRQSCDELAAAADM